MKEYVSVGNVLRREYNVNLEIWIDLRAPLEPGIKGVDFLKEVQEKYQGRFLCCINDYKISDGLRYQPEELAEWQNLGIAGYKITNREGRSAIHKEKIGLVVRTNGKDYFCSP